MAVDGEHFYAVDNSTIAKYAMASGELVARWSGPDHGLIRHLNSCSCAFGQALVRQLQLFADADGIVGRGIRRANPGACRYASCSASSKPRFALLFSSQTQRLLEFLIFFSVSSCPLWLISCSTVRNCRTLQLVHVPEQFTIQSQRESPKGRRSALARRGQGPLWAIIDKRWSM